MRLAATAAEEVQSPARSGEARGFRRLRQRQAGRLQGDAPPGFRRARCQQRRGVEAAAAPEQECRDAGVFRRQLQAARGGQAERAAELADDPCQRTMVQRLLGHQQHGGRLAGVHIDDPIRRQADERRARAGGCRAVPAPTARRRGCGRGGRPRAGPPRCRARPAGRCRRSHAGSERHSAARQPGVDGGYPERNDGGGAGPTHSRPPSMALSAAREAARRVLAPSWREHENRRGSKGKKSQNPLPSPGSLASLKIFIKLSSIDHENDAQQLVFFFFFFFFFFFRYEYVCCCRRSAARKPRPPSVSPERDH